MQAERADQVEFGGHGCRGVVGALQLTTIEGNGYEQMKASLPTNWYDAMDLTESSAFLQDYLGRRFLEIYCAIKRAEQDRFYSQVTELDFDWYLRTA